ncbi:DUF2784 domain-containing protein [Nocardia sp. NRRL S-836]|uniref:DUF2784 domain-containing protein n=1 Tax=Nocardia sp. NRRL S-836 TaxID=1519492 RepID=UPI0006AEA667|nr:DUF2784 domain-containing protein [Nocardia sp. NRRL S-836]KOV89013.1 hypothetical protein ADL03_03375 [Nocardia sp. NRRL S-836]
MARFLAEAVVVLHFAVLAFLLAGGFLAWRWRWVLYPHLALAAWAVLSLAVPTVCPLTAWENHFRAAAGMPVLETGFIDHYIDGVWYPESASVAVQLVLGAVVVVSWIGLVAGARTSRRVSVQ